MKKLFTLGLALTVLLARFGTVETFAHFAHKEILATEYIEEDSAALRGRLCSCGDFWVITNVTTTGWFNVSKENCTHYHWGVDIIQKHTKITEYRCPTCGRGEDIIEVETQTVCHGEDKPLK